MCSITYSSCGCIWDFFSTSRQMSEKKQGKRQWKKQRHTIGQTGTATSRHTALRLAKGESATIT